MSAIALESIVGQITRHAINNPEGIAVVDAKASLTYAELDRRSTNLAASLFNAGSRDQCVGLLLGRSAGFIVAALAAMKSGAAYLPFDEACPVGRVAAILKDARASSVLTNQVRGPGLPLGPWRVIDIDAAEPSGPRGRSGADVDPDDLAYIIYTSGSTGEPKGVEITHANLQNLIDWHKAAFSLKATDRASQVASLGFDAAIWEIWPYLATGATVCIADEVTRRSPQALREWMVRERITIGFAPTVLAEQMIRSPWPPTTALRTLLTGGEALRQRPIASLPFQVVNNYGPTECTVVATSGIVSPDGADLPSIGTPISNTVALLLNEELQPVVQGEVGELCLAGASVGRGYRNRPELTAEQFVDTTSPLGQPLRVYRTGDQARLLPNGEFLFAGRLDQQVKVRGHRIELAEIAAQLNGARGIEASVVSVQTVGEGGAAIVAYLVASPNAKLSLRALRAFLAERLPDYMVPPYFVAIGEIPITTNGKVDMSALPEPTVGNLLTDGLTESGGRSQDDSVRKQLSELIASMLGLPSIDPEDNFFMIGGHSMLGMELAARIRDTFGVKLSLRQLFTAPTVSALSAEVSRMASSVQ